ncbi:hypothetical protein A2J03_15500 [Rhodococcus sp. EPR-157]|uniref:helix-turn-helix domain-containing protein n=1 Tax=Rhodococcus sp. EPR-157 TaxID=1813677 RepID=UPI0007BC08A1|nr:helix-turn-helix domain-containing protein [Rhodococcus sp. EPR-157]KZF13335.1 hypothetical protein A2J03_15500 [Rhodococcus sp. EPR-157]
MSVLRQWEAFHAGQLTVPVDHNVLTSWRRSKWSGIDPLDVPIPHTEIPADSHFHRVATPVLLRMAESLADSSTSLALADKRGNVLWRWTSENSLARDLDSVHMVPGAVFDESKVGTNGIGTAIETGRLAVVVGAEHYVGSFHRWACAAAPVRHPMTGRIVGAVNVTCRAGDANQFFRWAAQSMADDVGHSLNSDLTSRERRLYDAYLHASRRTSSPLIAVDERTIIADEIASHIGLDHRTVWRAVRGEKTGSTVDLASTLTALITRIDEHQPTSGALLEVRIDAESTSPRPVPATAEPERLLHRHLSPLEVAEYEVVKAAMSEAGGNKTAAAARLEISRGTLYQKLEKYRLLNY